MTIGQDKDAAAAKAAANNIRAFEQADKRIMEVYKSGLWIRSELKGEEYTGALLTNKGLKEYKKKHKKSSLRLATSRHSSELSLINGELVFPELRVPDSRALNIIETFEKEIKELEEKKQAFIKDDFLAWNFLTYEQANEIINSERGKGLTPEQREARDKRLQEVIKDKFKGKRGFSHG